MHPNFCKINFRSRHRLRKYFYNENFQICGILSVLMQTGDINRALIDACWAGCIEKVTVLLDLGADVNYKDKVNSTCALTADVTHTAWSYTIERPISSSLCKQCW